MRDLILLFVHVVTTVMRMFQPGGVRAVIAESVLTKHQLLILNRLWGRQNLFYARPLIPQTDDRRLVSPC